MPRVESLASGSERRSIRLHSGKPQSQTTVNGSKTKVNKSKTKAIKLQGGSGSRGPATLASATDDELIRLHRDGDHKLAPLSENDITRGTDQPFDTLPDQVVIKFSEQPRHKAKVEVEALRACSGRFGTPSFVYSLRVADNDRFWLPVDSPSGTGSPEPDHRVRIATVCADTGVSLEHCRSPWQLGRALLDCMLGKQRFPSAKTSHSHMLRLAWTATMQSPAPRH